MHLQEADLFDAVLALRQVLKLHGRLLVSVPSTRADVGPDERDAGGRLFKAYGADELQLLLERSGFQLIGRWESDDALQRAGTRWFTLLLELRSGGPARAVDQIEGILNRDRKVATYKLALFRALAEIASQEPKAATWRPGGVAVPITRIAEKWLVYYWPLFASERFIPQSQSEGKGTTQPVAFRAAMSALIAAFASQGEYGGLAAWHSAWSTGKLGVELGRLQQAALRSIADTIRSGPVTYSGGALDTGPVFEFERASRAVVMSADLWRELCLLGHWIIDAVIVRWAALTERFGHRQGIRSGDVLPLLLARPAPERTTALARQIFLAGDVDRCVWSMQPVTRRQLAIDHVIPFSLWANNDLWNLQPAHWRINADKSDKLPASRLLQICERGIIENWRRLRDAVPEAFDGQAAHLLGRSLRGPLTWESRLFSSLREAVELTALQRGVERWMPSLL
jgi:hypothetical protein